MLLFNLKYLLVHLSHNIFKTLMVYQFSFATEHKLFKNIYRQSLLYKTCSYKLCKIHRKRISIDFLFNQVVKLQPVTLLKRRLRHRWFPVNLTKFLRMSTLENTSGQLSLCFVSFFCDFSLKRFLNDSPVFQKQQQ